jgi:hypothetical protein
MLPYAETLMPRMKKLTGDFIPAPSHFSNFEESVLDRSGGIFDVHELRPSFLFHALTGETPIPLFGNVEGSQSNGVGRYRVSLARQ